MKYDRTKRLVQNFVDWKYKFLDLPIQRFASTLEKALFESISSYTTRRSFVPFPGWCPTCQFNR